jgi:hypothetical protein
MHQQYLQILIFVFCWVFFIDWDDRDFDYTLKLIGAPAAPTIINLSLNYDVLQFLAQVAVTESGFAGVENSHLEKVCDH